MRTMSEDVRYGNLRRVRATLGPALVAALVTLALSGCEPLVDPEAKDLQREEQLVEDVELALQRLEDELDIPDPEIDQVVKTLQTLDQQDLNNAIQRVGKALRAELASIVPRQSRPSGGSAHSAVVQRQQEAPDTPPQVTELRFYYRFSGSAVTCTDIIAVSVDFSEPVVVTSELRLRFTVGSSEIDVPESWISKGAGPRDWMWFQYTPLVGDHDPDGIAVAELAFVGSTIEDEAGNVGDGSLEDAKVTIRHTSDDGSRVVDSHLPIDGRVDACRAGIKRSLGNIVDVLEDLSDEVTTEDFFLAAEDIDKTLRDLVDYLKGFDPQEFSDGVDDVVRVLDDWLRDLEQAELSEHAYRIVTLLNFEHVDQLVDIIDLLREIAERGVAVVGDYRRERTLELLDEVADELARLGSKQKLRRILYVTTERAPEVVVKELNRLGVGGTLGPVVTAIGNVIEEVADFIEERVL